MDVTHLTDKSATVSEGIEPLLLFSILMRTNGRYFFGYGDTLIIDYSLLTYSALGEMAVVRLSLTSNFEFRRGRFLSFILSGSTKYVPVEQKG